VITDDGGGFDPTHIAQRPHPGLEIMRERAASIGASLEISSAPGEGTTVTLRWPP
jgi:two-component system nitrate/nitrite sensor histidine kinase NarX